jgi:uroporphyrin-III C-methyltransferase
MTAQLFFMGAGPGDPDLLTVRALKILQSADVVLYDALVSDAILALVPKGTRRFAVGKRAGTPCIAQAEINRMLVTLCRGGRRVARLKGGDPVIFGRLAEELAAVRAAGIAFEVIPGITTASAAAASYGISLTERGLSRRVQFVTAHARAGDRLELDWESLADPACTTVFYMAREAASMISETLIARGMNAESPALLMSNVSRPSQRHKAVSLSELAQAAEAFPPGAPLIILIGPAVHHPDAIRLPHEAQEYLAG